MISGLWDMVMAVAPWLIAALAFRAMIRVAAHDMFTFEIDFAGLGVATLWLAVLILTVGGDLTEALMVAVLLAGITVCVHAIRPARIGQGDIWLMGFLGLAAGPDHIPAMLITFALLSLLTSACYSHARGKRLFRSMFPMALPGMGAAALALTLRMGGAAGGNVSGSALPVDGRVQALLVLGLVVGAACIGWAVARHNRQARMRRAASPLCRIDGNRTMNSSLRTTLLDPTPADLYQGGRSLLRLIDGMSGQNLRECRLELVQDRAEMVMIRADGVEIPGWGWPTMQVLGAVLFLRNLNLAPESRSLEPGLGEMAFIIEGSWGLLPPVVPALRCYCAALPDAVVRARLQVMTAEEARAETEAAASNPPNISWRIP